MNKEKFEKVKKLSEDYLKTLKEMGVNVSLLVNDDTEDFGFSMDSFESEKDQFKVMFSRLINDENYLSFMISTTSLASDYVLNNICSKCKRKRLCDASNLFKKCQKLMSDDINIKSFNNSNSSILN